MCPLVNPKILKPVLKGIQRHVCTSYPKVHGGNALVPPLTSEACCWCCCCCCCIASVLSESVRPHRWQPARLLRPRDFPGKSAGKRQMPCIPPHPSGRRLWQDRQAVHKAPRRACRAGRQPLTVTAHLQLMLTEAPLHLFHSLSITLASWAQFTSKLPAGFP